MVPPAPGCPGGPSTESSGTSWLLPLQAPCPLGAGGSRPVNPSAPAPLPPHSPVGGTEAPQAGAELALGREPADVWGEDRAAPEGTLSVQGGPRDGSPVGGRLLPPHCRPQQSPPRPASLPRGRSLEPGGSACALRQWPRSLGASRRPPCSPSSCTAALRAKRGDHTAWHAQTGVTFGAHLSQGGHNSEGAPRLFLASGVRVRGQRLGTGSGLEEGTSEGSHHCRALTRSCGGQRACQSQAGAGVFADDPTHTPPPRRPRPRGRGHCSRTYC